MNPHSCLHEAEVARAARSGIWDEGTSTHAASCDRCREVALVTGWMIRAGGAPDGAPSRLPDPRQIYHTARNAAALKKYEAALRPLAIAELVLRGALVLALALGMLWAWIALRPLGAAVHLSMPQPLGIAFSALIPCLLALLSARLTRPLLE